MQLQICLIENSTKEHNFEKIMDPRLDMYLRKYKPTYFCAVLDLILPLRKVVYDQV